MANPQPCKEMMHGTSSPKLCDEGQPSNGKGWTPEMMNGKTLVGNDRWQDNPVAKRSDR